MHIGYGLKSPKETFRFHKMSGNSVVAAQLVAFQEGLNSMKLA
jgi:hypothetical protein